MKQVDNLKCYYPIQIIVDSLDAPFKRKKPFAKSTKTRSNRHSDSDEDEREHGNHQKDLATIKPFKNKKNVAVQNAQAASDESVLIQENLEHEPTLGDDPFNFDDNVEDDAPVEYPTPKHSGNKRKLDLVEQYSSDEGGIASPSVAKAKNVKKKTENRTNAASISDSRVKNGMKTKALNGKSSQKKTDVIEEESDSENAQPVRAKKSSKTTKRLRNQDSHEQTDAIQTSDGNKGVRLIAEPPPKVKTPDTVGGTRLFDLTTIFFNF